MGCCGCDNRTSVITGGIFAIIQCVVGIALAIYNLQIFYGDCLPSASDKGYFCSVLWSSVGGIRALLIIVVVLYSIWIISSIFLLMGNANNRVGYIRQWVVISTIVIICDIIFPSVLVGISFSTILHQYEYTGYYTSTTILPANERNLSQQYMTLLIAFSRGGLITWCCDIALTVYASHRIREILNPPRAYVYTQAFPATSQGIVNPLQYPNAYPQGAFPSGPQNFQQPNYYLTPGQNNPYEFAAPPPSYTSVKPPQ